MVQSVVTASSYLAEAKNCFSIKNHCVNKTHCGLNAQHARCSLRFNCDAIISDLTRAPSPVATWRRRTATWRFFPWIRTACCSASTGPSRPVCPSWAPTPKSVLGPSTLCGKHSLVYLCLFCVAFTSYRQAFDVCIPLNLRSLGVSLIRVDRCCAGQYVSLRLNSLLGASPSHAWWFADRVSSSLLLFDLIVFTFLMVT